SMVGAGGANAMHGLANAAAVGVTSSSAGNFTFSDMYDLIDAVDFRVEDDEAGAFYVSRTFRRACLALKESDAKWSQSFYRVGKQWYFDGFPVHVFPALPGVATGQVPCMFGDPMAYKIRLVAEPRFYQSLQPNSADQIEFTAFWDADGGLADTNAIKKLTIA
nr:phage major capsid protein [Phycisphaeraceae bacterium]